MLRSRSMSPAVKTYEDQLITNYFELLNKNRCTKKNRRYCTPEYLKADYSPYMSKQLQKPQSPSKQTPFNISESQCQRPFSAPGEKKRRLVRPCSTPLVTNASLTHIHFIFFLLDALSSTNDFFVEKYVERSQSSFRNQPPVIVVKAFRNGDLSFFTRVTAPDLPMLLEVCTKRLKLPFAARIVYLEDGTRVEHPLDIPKEAVIYVSMGEMFQDPKQKSKESLLDQIGSEWTLSGINLPVRKRKKKNPMTNRMRALTVKKNIRIIVYENGYSHKPIEIAADTNKMEEFMMDCTYKLKLRGFARHLYNWEGETVTDLNDTPILSDCLQQNNGLILGPLWVSKGEPFEPSGTGKYLLEQHKVLKQRLKYAKSQKQELSISQRLCETQKPKIAPNVQKVFLSSGEELKDVLSLEYDEQIWLSFGEAYISPYSKTSQWMAVDNFPRDIETTKVQQPFQEFDKNELEGTWHFLQNKINNNQVLFPEVVINHKLPRSNKELWPSNSQIWLISKNGVIYCKAMPQLCLAVYTDFWIKDQLLQEQELKVSGYVVGLQKKNNYDPNQTWIFNSNGTVSSKVYPVLLLTWLRNLLHESIKEEIVDNSDRSLKLGHNIYLIISEMLPKKHAALQRWAIKQERFDNLGQWKHTQVLNPEWNKLAYSWPVCMDTGTINEKYDWPMEGYLIPNAPQLYKNKNNGSKLSGIAPIRLMVLRNGERNLSKAVPVVGPNVTNMMKALSGKKRAKSAQCNTSDDAESSVQDENIHIGDRNLHCNPLTVRKLEFTMFLDSCTSTLKLPSSARRLFTDTGEELFTLQDLNRDQLVYVSCQERWLNPKVTASEQRRRFLLTQLASDLRKIRKYCNLRDQSNYVLTINKTLAPGSKLIVAPLIVSNSNPPKENSLESHASENLSFYGDNSHEEDKHNIKTYKSWHDISHIYSDEYINKLKWPWENLVNIDQCGNAEGKEDMYTQEDSVSEKQSFKNNSHGQHLTSPEGLQKFVYADSYIGCAENPNLVLTAMQSEGRSAEVVLKKRTPDNINQRWIIKSNGEIRSRFGHNMVLTVAMPVSETGGHASYIGCSVILKTKKENLYGEAHQRWYYDAETGYIKAFEADVLNKEITAANSSNICTFAITFKTKIDQPGYLVDVSQEQDFSTDQNISPKKLCLSCSYTLRGRCSMQKLKPGTEFSCAMGDQDPDLKRKRLSGSFQLLNGKVDLSTHEALLTLQVWEDKLLCFREETSMQTIGKEISAAQYINVIKLLAYKNGDGRLHSGHIVIGSTLEGLLMQCTRVLGLSNAARAMFTENGEQILDIEDLIKVAEKNYKKELTFHVENYIKEKLC
ncbi:domain-containing 1-like, partial [Argonauta hians]